MKRSFKLILSALTALIVPALGWATEVTWTGTGGSTVVTGTLSETVSFAEADCFYVSVKLDGNLINMWNGATAGAARPDMITLKDSNGNAVLDWNFRKQGGWYIVVNGTDYRLDDSFTDMTVTFKATKSDGTWSNIAVTASASANKLGANALTGTITDTSIITDIASVEIGAPIGNKSVGNVTVAVKNAPTTHDREINGADEVWNVTEGNEWTDNKLPVVVDTVNLTPAADGAKLNIDTAAVADQLIIDGDYALTMTGTGSLTVNSTTVNTDTDVSTITGTVNLGATTVAADKTLTVGANTTMASVTNGTLAIAAGETYALSSTSTLAESVKFNVGAGSTFDVNGRANYNSSGIFLNNGATLKNSGSDIGQTSKQWTGLSLAENANVTFSGNTFGAIASQYATHTVYLNGGTIDFALNSGKTYYAASMNILKTAGSEASEEAGTLKVTSGTLQFSNTANTNANTHLVLNGGIVTLATNYDFGSLSGDGTFNVNGKTTNIGVLGGDKIFSGAFASNGTGGTINKQGSGTLTLSGNNTASGVNLFVKDGEAIITSTFAGQVTVDTGKTLTVNAGATLSNALTNNGLMTVNGGTVSGAITNAGTLTYATADVTPANTISGAGKIVADGITLNLTAANLDGFTGTYEVTNGGTLILPAGKETAENVTLTNGTLALQLSTEQMLSGYTAKIDTVTFLNASGEAITAEDGTVDGNTFTPALNTWKNTTADGKWATDGNWTNGAAPGETDSVAIEITADTTITLETAVTVANLTVKGSGTLTIEGAALTVTGTVVANTNVTAGAGILLATKYSIADETVVAVENTADQTVNSIHGGTFTKTGTGRLTVVPATSGETVLQDTTLNVNGGTLYLNSASSTGATKLDTVTLAFAEGASWIAYGWPEFANTVTIDTDHNITMERDGGNYYAAPYGTATIVKDGTGTFSFSTRGGNVAIPLQINEGAIGVLEGGTLSGVISGAGKLVNNASGTTLTLSGANTYTGGTEIAAGATVQIASLGNLGSSGDVNIADGGKLNIYVTGNTQDHGQAWNRLKGNGTVAYNSNGSWHTFPNVANPIPTTLGVENNLANGLILPEPAQAYKVGSLSGNGAFRVDFGGSADNPRSLEIIQSKNTTFSGGMLTNNSPDRLSGFFLSGADGATDKTLTYSGTTTVAKPMTINASGVLNLTGNWTGDMTNNGVLGGTGTIGGALTLNAGSTLNATADKLTVTGDVTLPTDGTVTVTLPAEAGVGTEVLACANAADLDLTKLSAAPVGLKWVAVDGVIKLATAAVCSDGSNSYTSINACIEAMVLLGTSDFYIYIIADTAEEVTLPADSTLTFIATTGNFSGTVKDENGNTITAEGGTYDTHTYIASVTVTTTEGIEETDCETFDDVLNELEGVEEATVTFLTVNPALTETWVIDNKAITLDLGNTTVEATFTYTAANPAAIWVKNGGALTIQNGTLSSAAEAIRLGVKGATDDTQAGTVTIESTATITSSDIAIMVYGGSTLTSSGKITATAEGFAAIQGNGQETVPTTITITGGTISSENVTIYHPQPGTLTLGVDNAEGLAAFDPYITGLTPVEMRAGSLVMKSGYLMAEATAYSVTADNNGSTTIGAALAISQHDSDAAAEGISVEITGGQIYADAEAGLKALSVTNVSGADAVTVTGSIAGDALAGDTAITVPTVALEGDAETGYTLETRTTGALIGNAWYETLAEAVAAAEEGDTITLLGNEALTEVVKIETDVTIDLNGKTVTATGCNALWAYNADLIITDSATGGKVVAAGAQAVRVGDNIGSTQDMTKAAPATFTLNGGTIEGKWAVTIWQGSTVTVNGGTITGVDAGISGNGFNAGTTITVTDGTISGTSCGIYHPQAGTLTIDGGTISGATGIEMRAGAITMTAGTVTATGTYTTPGANNSGSTSVGVAIALSQHATAEALEGITANITGGNLIADNGKALLVANTTQVDPTPYTVTIDADVGVVAEDVVVEVDTLDVKTDDDGTITLKTVVAAIGEAKYETLQDAYNNAAENDTITLLGDTTGKGLVINKPITIDFNGFTYTVNHAVGSTGTQTLGMQIDAATVLTSTAVAKGKLTCLPCNLTYAEATENGVADCGYTSEKPVRMLINNYADLTVTNVILDGSNLAPNKDNAAHYVLSNNSGDVKIGDKAEIKANDGDFAFDVCKYRDYEAPTVTVETGAAITGTVEVTGGTLDNKGDELDVVIASGTVTGDVAVDTTKSTYLVEVNGVYCNEAVDAKGNDATDAVKVFTGIATGVDGTTATVAWQFGISKLERSGEDIVITAKVTRADGETAAGYAADTTVTIVDADGNTIGSTETTAAGIATFTVDIADLVGKQLKVKATKATND